MVSMNLTSDSILTTATTSSTSPILSRPQPYTYCDARLEHLTVKYWTRIPIDDQLAARAISHFLETDHPVLGYFDADLFLHDLVNQCLRFCSSFLFSSVMALACVRLYPFTPHRSHLLTSTAILQHK
jgi:hypothetical protein